MSPYYCPSLRPQQTYAHNDTHSLLPPALPALGNSATLEASVWKRQDGNKKVSLEQEARARIPSSGCWAAGARKTSGQYSRVQRTEGKKNNQQHRGKVQSVLHTQSSMHRTHTHRHTDRLLLTRDTQRERQWVRQTKRPLERVNVRACACVCVSKWYSYVGYASGVTCPSTFLLCFSLHPSACSSALTACFCFTGGAQTHHYTPRPQANKHHSYTKTQSFTCARGGKPWNIHTTSTTQSNVTGSTLMEHPALEDFFNYSVKDTAKERKKKHQLL